MHYHNRVRLANRFPGQYYRVSELGNSNHHLDGAPMAYVDLEVGIEKSQQIIAENARGQGVIYLCACEQWTTCHRSQIAGHLQEAIPEATVVHIHPTGSLTIIGGKKELKENDVKTILEVRAYLKDEQKIAGKDPASPEYQVFTSLLTLANTSDSVKVFLERARALPLQGPQEEVKEAKEWIEIALDKIGGVN